MRKFLLSILLVIIGVFSFGAEATVTVRARLVDEELVIGGQNNKPLILDFNNLEAKNNQDLDFFLQYTGTRLNKNGAKIEMDIQSDVSLVNENTNSTLKSQVRLDKNSGVVLTKNNNFKGNIKGNIEDITLKPNGLYTGVTQLNITVIPM